MLCHRGDTERLVIARIHGRTIGKGGQSNVARSAPAGDVPAGAAVNVYLGAVPVTTES